MIDQPNNEAAPAFGRIEPRDALIAIRAENRRTGLSVSEADEIEMANQIASTVRHDMATGRTFIVNGDGNPHAKLQDGALVDLTVADMIAALQTTAKAAPRSKPSLVNVSAGANRTERAIATKAAQSTPVSEWKAAEAVKLVERFGNPWITGNTTHKAIVTNTNQELAAKLKLEAGIKP